MKTLKTVCIVAIFSMGLFASCTPESLENETNTEQQIDPAKIRPLNNG